MLPVSNSPYHFQSAAGISYKKNALPGIVVNTPRNFTPDYNNQISEKSYKSEYQFDNYIKINKPSDFNA